MYWSEPATSEDSHAELEKKLWYAANMFWAGADLKSSVLGYAEWSNFNQFAVSKTKSTCEILGHGDSDHFVDVNKMVGIGSGIRREEHPLHRHGPTAGLAARDTWRFLR